MKSPLKLFVFLILALNKVYLHFGELNGKIGSLSFYCKRILWTEECMPYSLKKNKLGSKRTLNTRKEKAILVEHIRLYQFTINFLCLTLNWKISNLISTIFSIYLQNCKRKEFVYNIKSKFSLLLCIWNKNII